MQVIRSSCLILLAGLVAHAQATCVTPAGIDDAHPAAILSSSVTIPPFNPAPGGFPGIFPVLAETFVPFVTDYETPIQFRMFQMISLVVFSGSAMHHPTSLDHFADEANSAARRRCQPGAHPDPLFELHQDLTVAYSVYFGTAKIVGAEAAAGIAAVMSSFGIDATKCNIPADCEDTDTPWGLAYTLTEEMAVFAEHDGWNADGSLSRTFNKRPYQDFRQDPYTPRNSPWELRRKRRWQPLPEDNGKGYMVHQEHVVPHAGFTGRGIFMSDQQHCDLTAPPPHYDYEVENEAVIDRAAGLDDTKKMQIEFFDGKLGSIVPLLAQYMARTGNHLSRYDWFKVDMAVNNILYEAVQVVWREKVRYDRVRPPSRIHDDLEGETITSYAGAFQGTQSMPAEDWEPYIRTMPHSEYPSGSSCICEAFAEYMRLETGSDSMVTALAPSTPPGAPVGLIAEVPAGSSIVEPGVTPANPMVHFFDSWSGISDICGQSRLDGGMHYDASVPAGANLCRSIASTVKDAFDALESGTRPDYVVNFADTSPEFKQDKCVW